jgi:hypothetical protein
LSNLCGAYAAINADARAVAVMLRGMIDERTLRPSVTVEERR